NSHRPATRTRDVAEPQLHLRGTGGAVIQLDRDLEPLSGLQRVVESVVVGVDREQRSLRLAGGASPGRVVDGHLRGRAVVGRDPATVFVRGVEPVVTVGRSLEPALVADHVERGVHRGYVQGTIQVDLRFAVHQYRLRGRDDTVEIASAGVSWV